MRESEGVYFVILSDARTDTHTDTHARTDTHTYGHMDTHTHTDTRTHTHIRTHGHTHTHSCEAISYLSRLSTFYYSFAGLPCSVSFLVLAVAFTITVNKHNVRLWPCGSWLVRQMETRPKSGNFLEEQKQTSVCQASQSRCTVLSFVISNLDCTSITWLDTVQDITMQHYDWSVTYVTVVLEWCILPSYVHARLYTPIL